MHKILMNKDHKMKTMETITIAQPAEPSQPSTSSLPATKSTRPYLLKLGQVVITPGALAEITDAEQTPFEFLLPHMHGNWGELCKEDKELNDLAVHQGDRILSAYRTGKNVKIWIITEWDRSVTTILLPQEY
jgi:hypothetical protein